MSRKYYYGLERQEVYTAVYPHEVLENFDPEQMIGLVIVEMTPSRASGVRSCGETKTFVEGAGWCEGCDFYSPRNKKSGICKYLEWGLIETGRKWVVEGPGLLKKLSGRKKT